MEQAAEYGLVEALIADYTAGVLCSGCRLPLNGAPYRQERWRPYHVECEPADNAWRAKARRSAVKAMRKLGG